MAPLESEEATMNYSALTVDAYRADMDSYNSSSSNNNNINVASSHRQLLLVEFRYWMVLIVVFSLLSMFYVCLVFCFNLFYCLRLYCPQWGWLGGWGSDGGGGGGGGGRRGVLSMMTSLERAAERRDSTPTRYIDSLQQILADQAATEIGQRHPPLPDLNFPPPSYEELQQDGTAQPPAAKLTQPRTHFFRSVESLPDYETALKIEMEGGMSVVKIVEESDDDDDDDDDDESLPTTPEDEMPSQLASSTALSLPRSATSPSPSPSPSREGRVLSLQQFLHSVIDKLNI